ncbi:MAG: HprK-related kinase A [Sphingomonadales bacterium]
MKHAFAVRVGPVSFRIGSAWAGPIRDLEQLYSDYPRPTGVCDYTVRLEPARPWRRWLRPSVAIAGDFMLPEAAPLPLSLGLLAAEMGMNLQLALGERRFLLLHAATVERNGRALILTGESGAGKSTLATLLGSDGWRFMGDEFALIEPKTGLAWPFPRPSSLKNESIDAALAVIDPAKFGPLLKDTPKGDIRHVVPPADALASMAKSAEPALILFPQFGLSEAARPVPQSEAFVRLTQASTNYVALGERGFSALTHLVQRVPSVALDYPDMATARRMIDDLWAAL